MLSNPLYEVTHRDTPISGKEYGQQGHADHSGQFVSCGLLPLYQTHKGHFPATKNYLSFTGAIGAALILLVSCSNPAPPEAPSLPQSFLSSAEQLIKRNLSDPYDFKFISAEPVDTMPLYVQDPDSLYKETMIVVRYLYQSGKTDHHYFFGVDSAWNIKRANDDMFND